MLVWEEKPADSKAGWHKEWYSRNDQRCFSVAVGSDSKHVVKVAINALDIPEQRSLWLFGEHGQPQLLQTSAKYLLGELLEEVENIPDADVVSTLKPLLARWEYIPVDPTYEEPGSTIRHRFRGRGHRSRK
jgi:hypothetical protein